MEDQLTTFFIIIYLISIFISFLFLLTISRKKDIPTNLRFLYLYPLGAIIVFGFYVLGRVEVIKFTTYQLINSVSLVYHLGFLGFFILYEISNKKLKRISKYLLGFFFMALGVGIIYRTDFWRLDAIAASMGLFFLATLYFIDVFINVPSTKLSNIPSFWVIIGIFLHMVINIPPLTLAPYIKTYFPESFPIVAIISLSASIIMFLSFIKGVVCLKSHLK
ncbi:MAG TPA: hypothetical protein PKA85_09655, partial [Ferruginibacter sp.]|nr:hypothetical protein [Ferruginibacter sp.]